MLAPDFVMLYVNSPEKSAAVMFASPSGVRLCLWSARTVQAGGGSMAFSVTEESAVDAWSCFWAGRGCMASGMEAAQLDLRALIGKAAWGKSAGLVADDLSVVSVK